MDKKTILFVCIHNSARSQIAEAIINNYHGDRFFAESAGIEAGKLNPFAVEVLKEIGIDISGKSTNDVFDFFKAGKRYNYVVTVCDEANAERCPIFPGAVETIHWSFKDPSSFEGSDAEKLEFMRTIRNEMKAEIEKWTSEN